MSPTRNNVPVHVAWNLSVIMNANIIYTFCRVTSVLGFVPQELTGTSIYEYCHRDSLQSFSELHKEGSTLLFLYFFKKPGEAHELGGNGSLGSTLSAVPAKQGSLIFKRKSWRSQVAGSKRINASPLWSFNFLWKTVVTVSLRVAVLSTDEPLSQNKHRLRSKSGSYVSIGTTARAFCNPWTKEREQIVCTHSLLS